MTPPNDVLTAVTRKTRSRNGSKAYPLADPTAKLLISRAHLLDAPGCREKRMFVQFDAWTDPGILGWIEKHGKHLPPSAKKLFATGRPSINKKHLICGLELLKNVPLNRAMLRTTSEIYGVPVRVSERVARILEANQTTVQEVIRNLAEYMHKIFSKHFHQNGKKTPSHHLEAAFARFASGMLRIKEGGGQQLNAEPDSAYFFIFAEFCIQAACYRAHPGRKWWLALAGLFAALQDVYCYRYLRNGAQRRFAEYSDLFFNDRRRIPDELLLDHVASVQKRDGNLEKLAERVTWNAFWYFFDEIMG